MMNAFACDPLAGIIYVATVNGVFEMDNAGSSWRELNDGLGCLETLCIVFDSNQGSDVNRSDNLSMQN